METSVKIAYEDLFSTDIDVIRRNIGLGKYTDIDAELILETNRKIDSLDGANSQYTVTDFSDYIDDMNNSEIKTLAVYLNIYHHNSEIDFIVELKEKNIEMKHVEKLFNWVFLQYDSFHFILNS